MAGNACSLTCNVKDVNGEVKVSELWKALQEYFKEDRKEALAHYFLTKDSNFLTRNSDVLEFDVDGEVTIASLKKALERDGEFSDLSNRKILDKLNKELGKSRYNYSEALENVLKFNKSHQFKENFMASLKQEKDGRYSVYVQERTPQAEYALAEHVRNKIFTEAIKNILKEKGFSIDFLDKSSYAVHYSTMNMPIEDGFYTIANILDGVNTSREAAEVAGHFIVGAMQDSPLISRLISLLTPEVQQELFGNKKSALYRQGFLVSSESAREAAGILIGRDLWHSVFDKQISFSEKVSTQAVKLIPKAIKNALGLRWLLNKIVNGVKKAFGKYKPDVVKEMMRQAREAASTAAQGFISNPEAAEASNILGREDVFTTKQIHQELSEKAKKNVEAYYKTFNSLKETVSVLKNAVANIEAGSERDLYKKFEKLSENIASSFNGQMQGFTAEGASLEGIVSIIEGMVYLLDNDMRDILNDLDTSNRATASTSYADNARSLRVLQSATRNIAELYRGLLADVNSINAAEKVMIQDADMVVISESINDAVAKLGKILFRNEETYTNASGEEQVVSGLSELIIQKSRQVMIDAYTDFYGQNYITRNARVLFKNWKLHKVEAHDVDVSTLIESLEEDISWTDRYISAAADCGDFFTSVGNKVTRMANMSADRVAAEYWYKMDALEKQMQDAFGTTDFTMLLEVIKNEDGGVDRTGNIVSKVNVGAWERDFDDFKKKLKADFREHLANLRKKAYQKHKNTPGYVYTLSDRQRAILYHAFADKKIKEFHKTYSEKQKIAGGKEVWVPNQEKYHNEQWDELFDVGNPGLTDAERAAREKKLRWYNAFMNTKRELDGLLPMGSTRDVRLPQFTGRLSHRFKNLKAQMNNSLPAFGHALRSKCNDAFVIRDDEGWMFGSDNEFNELEQDPLESLLYYKKEKINRLPIYGVNKLHDMTLLSTDIFGSMIRYASMAATFNAMSKTVDVFELAKDVMKNRRFENKGNKSEKELDAGTSKAYTRYIKFLEKNVYGLTTTPPEWKRSKVWIKIANNLASLGGKVLLYGNLHGGVVNWGTGALEVFKEAMAGENFTRKEFLQAIEKYYSGLFRDTDGYIGSFTNMFINPQRPVDKNSLWIRHWNILSQNRMFLHNQKFDTKAMSFLDNRLGDWYGHTMMLPYSSGDHWMQTIPYYAMGIHTKVYDHDGNQMDLMDAYDIVDGEYVYAIDDPTKEGEKLGRTPKRLKLKDQIFRSVADINTYDTVQSMLSRINNLIANSTGTLNNNSPVGIEWSREEIEYMNDKGYTLPTNFKQLTTLKNALQVDSGNLLYNDSDESAFMDKCRNICNRLHGIYNAEDKVTAQQNFAFNLILAMRGYALGMISRRFADDRFNIPQGKNVEGNWNTLSKVMFSIWQKENYSGVARSLLFGVPIFNMYAMFSKKFGDKVMADMQKAGFSEHQYYNMRRCGADALILQALMLMNLAASPGLHSGTDDDDNSNWGWGMLYYFTMRWIYEQGAFNIMSPKTMWKETTTLLDYVPAGLSGLFALGELITLFIGAQLTDEEDKKDSPFFYKQSKKGVYEEGEAKYKKRLRGLFPYLRTYYAMRKPYVAASSYEYGRKVKGR